MTMMSVKLLSVLVSLAMMLTGTYGVEAPQAASRTLTLSNVTLTVNGESTTLEPSLSLGVSTDGAKALFTAAVLSGGRELFPVQLSVTEDALTALAKNADTAVTLPASAIDAVTDQLTSQVSDEAGTQISELITFYTQEYIPAYTKVLQKAMDPEASAELREKAQALMDEKIDRGEGQPGSVEIDGQEYDCTTYHYTVDAAQLMAITDELATMDEDFAALYSAMFKLYDMMPEESGLKGLHSFADLAEKTGLTLTAEYTDSISGDGSARQQDIVVTLDLASMVATMSDTGADLSDASDVAPMVIYSSTTQVGDDYRSTANMEYTVEDVAITMDAESSQDADSFAMVLDMTMDAGDNGSMQYTLNADRIGDEKHVETTMDFTAENVDVDSTMTLRASANPDTGNKTYGIDATLDVVEPQNIRFAMSAEGEMWPEGDSHNSVLFSIDTGDQNASLGFDADVSTDAIQEAVAGSDALVIEDLTNLNALASDEISQGKLMQAAGSFMADAGTLTSEASVTRMFEMIQGLYVNTTDSATAQPDKSVEVPEADEGAVDEEVTYDGAQADDPEDDGALPYEMPQFAYIPEGWEAGETEVDTAYDQVVMTFADESYENSMYAIFSAGTAQGEAYVMNGEGKLVAADGQDVKVEHLDEDNWVATVVHGDVTAELYITSGTVDLDTIAQIVNGLTF